MSDLLKRILIGFNLAATVLGAMIGMHIMLIPIPWCLQSGWELAVYCAVLGLLASGFLTFLFLCVRHLKRIVWDSEDVPQPVPLRPQEDATVWPPPPQSP